MRIDKLAALLAATSLTLTPIAATAQDAPRVFTQSGQWTLDFGDDYCQLASIYTDGEDEIALALERNRADNMVRLILVGDSIRTFRAAEEIGYHFLPAGDERRTRYIKSQTPDGRAYFNFGNIFIGDPPMPGPDFVIPPYSREAELESARAINGIELEEGLLRGIRLQTGSMRAPIQALQTCMDDLLNSLGLDFQKHQTMTRRAAPAGPAWEWIPRGTIGFQDFAAFGGARNPVRVMVSAEGRPTACHVHWPSLEASKNTAICEAIMENGSFTPALDSDGEAMASYWTADPFLLNRPFGQ